MWKQWPYHFPAALDLCVLINYVKMINEIKINRKNPYKENVSVYNAECKKIVKYFGKENKEKKEGENEEGK